MASNRNRQNVVGLRVDNGYADSFGNFAFQARFT